MKRIYLITALLGLLFFSLKPAHAQHFTPVYTSVYQPMNILVSAADLDASGLVAGDEIGIFDVDGGSEICVGSFVLTGPIGATPINVIASTDDPITPAKDGFSDGNTIIYRYWDNSASVEITCVTPSYTTGTGLNTVFTSLGTALVSLDGITSPTADAGADDEICEGSDFTTSGSATSYSSISWSTSGTGTFTNGNTLTATYTPSAADITAGSVTLTLTASAIAPCSGDATDDMILSFQEAPTADAGADDEICEGSDFTTSGSATNYAGVSWGTSGTGTFTNGNTLTATYTPSAADITAGSVTLTLTATPNAPCASNATDDMVLSFQEGPTADAGADDDICEGSDFTTSGTATNYAGVSWATSGTGTFTNGNTLTATYTPSAADITAGSVTLTLTATAVAPCSGNATDDMVLSFQESPTADAGADDAICEGSDFTTAGAATNYSGVSWSSSGTGTFTNGNTLTATYTPSAADITAGSVTLTLTATAIAPCSGNATDDMVLSFQEGPTADAGADDAICEGSDFTTSGTATNYAGVSWATSGTGTFTNGNTLTATYTPSAADITAGSVTLTLTATAVAPCSGNATDDMVLSFQESPTADAGADDAICEGSDFTTSGTATNYAGVSWATSGTGTFTNGNTLTATYTPSAADITAGSVTLTLTATAIAPCSGNATDDMVLSFQEGPTADAGADDDICEGSDFTTAGSATNYAGVSWATSGTGTFTNGNTLTATYTPSAADITAGSVTLTLTATAIAPCSGNATDDMVLSFQEGPTADAGADDAICEGSDFTTAGAATNYSGVSWSSSGTGTFTNGNTLTATYTPSTADITAGSVTLTLTATAIAPCGTDATDDMVLSFQESPTADAGDDDAICEGSDFTTSGTATNYAGVSWATSGTGTFTNGNTLTATYTPSAADITAGSVTLTLTATAVAPCSGNATDDMVLSFQEGPTADAGADDAICEGSDFTTSGAATNYAGVSWASSGTGTFTNGNTLTATYTPSAADITAGSVTLTLTATAVAPCSADATDDMVLSFQEGPTADAGADADICETDTYTLSGTASNYGAVSWSTSGTGTFTNGTTLTATYTPSAADITAGSVTLTLTATAILPCGTDATDDMTLNIYGQPTANAGSDAGICEDATYTLNGSATNQQSVSWSSAGDGTFDNASLLNATYDPGPNDISNGSVVLTLTAVAVSPCGSNATDDMTLSIQELPTVYAGIDATICEDGSHTLSGSANNQFSVSWSTAGDGSFDDPVLLAATYTPGPNDIAAGSVVLTLTATSVPPCSSDVTDDMTLTIQGLPTANAGPDDTVAEGSSYTLSGSASNQTSVLWTTAGDGSFDNAALLGATYTPGANDIDNGSVVLTLTSNATAPCGGTAVDDMTLYISITQSINLNLGWNIMSFYVVPADVDLLNIVNPLVTNSTLIKVIDENGDFIEFLTGPGWVNYIGDMANTEGYYIKVNAGTTLDAHGTQVVLPYNIPLFTGWNMAGYPVKTQQDALTALATLIGNNSLIKVMDESGNFIQNIPPYGWFNTIVNFEPDEGYYIKVSSDDVLTINQPTKGATPGQPVEVPATEHFFQAGSNPYSPMNIIVQNIIADGFVPEDGDEIAVYDGDIEVGSAVIHQGYDGYQVITACGDDPDTEITDGFTAGNSLSFKYWDKSYNTTYENIETTHLYGDETFTGLGTYMGELRISALGTPDHSSGNALAFLGQNYPNPFTQNTSIAYGLYEGGDVLLSIFDVSGRRIQIVEDAYKARGRYTVEFRNTDLEPGVYYYQLEVSGSGMVFTETRKMIVH